MSDTRPENVAEERFLRVSEVAVRLSLSLSTVYQLIESGRLPSHCVGLRKGIRVAESDLLAYLERCRSARRQAPAAAPKKSGSPFRHLDGERLRSAWRRQGVPFDPPDARNARSSGSSYDP